MIQWGLCWGKDDLTQAMLLLEPGNSKMLSINLEILTLQIKLVFTFIVLKVIMTVAISYIISEV